MEHGGGGENAAGVAEGLEGGGRPGAGDAEDEEMDSALRIGGADEREIGIGQDAGEFQGGQEIAKRRRWERLKLEVAGGGELGDFEGGAMESGAADVPDEHHR